MRHNNNRRMKNRGGSSNSNNSGPRRGNSNVPPRMQVFDSNGPDVRIRGTAWQVHEKYLALAKDAAAIGDVVMAESYSQHAEHYQRIINTFAEQMGPQMAGQWAPQPAQNDHAIDMDGNMMPGQVQVQQQNQPQQQQAQTPRRDDGRPAADLGLPSSLFKAPASPALETA